MLSPTQMAAPDSKINRQLFYELKQKYPEVPDSIVTGYMIQHSNNKNKCLEVLAVESPKHMFGDLPSAPDASGAQVVQQMGDLALDAQNARQRSDSGSSAKSNASTGSLPSLGAGHVASLARAWPPAQPSGNSGQGSAAACHGDMNAMPKNSPVSPSELGKYITQSQSTGQIPNIECNTHISGQEPPHGSSSQVATGTNSSSNKFNMYNHPQVVLSHGVYGAQGCSDGSAPAVTPGSVHNWISQTSANVSHNNSNAYSAGQFAVTSMNTQQNCTGAGHSTTLSNVQGLAMQQPQHLSQATIYIQQNADRNQVVSQASQLPMHLPGQIAVQPQLKIQQPPVSHQGAPIPVHHFTSKSDQQMLPQTQHFGTPPRQSLQNDSHVQQGGIYQHPAHSLSHPGGGQNVGRPVIVQWQSSVPGNVHYNYPPSTRPVGQSHICLEVNPNSPTRTHADFSTPCNPPSLVYRPVFNPPDLPVRRNIMESADVPTVSYPAQTTLLIPNYQTVTTTTIPQYSKVRNSGGEPVDVNASVNVMMPTPNNYDMGQVMSLGHSQPIQNMVMSPSSSHSSLSSESSQREGRSRRSGSLQEDREYIQALLSHQEVQKAKLHGDLEKESRKLDHLQDQVGQMESNMAESSTTFPSLEDLVKLRDSNRKILTEIQCMTREVDMYNHGRTPLGVLDLRDQQNFFQHLDRGPGAPLAPVMPVGMRPPHRLPPQPPVPSRPGPQTPARTTPPIRTVNKPLPPVPPPQPTITQTVPPAPPTQPHSSSGDSEEGDQWSCSACTFLNHPALNKCECCEMPRVTIGSR